MLPLHQGRMIVSGSRGTRTHKRTCRRLFSRQRPHPAGWLPFVEISSGGWNRMGGLLVQSQASLPAATTPDRSCSNDKCACAWFASSCGGRNRTCGLLVQSQASLPTATTPHHRECPAGVEPASPGWKAGTFAARSRAREGGKGGSRTLKAVTLDRFRGGCHRQLACPSVKLRRQESNLRHDG